MSALPFIVAAVAATIALATDLSQRRIPNWLTATTLTLGLLGNLWLHGQDGGLTALAGAALGLGLLLPVYLLRAMGAGDVKLLAALGAVLGPQVLVSVAVYGAIVGGLRSLVVMLHRGSLQAALFQLVAMRQMPTQSGGRAPYAIAIASGVYLAMVLPPVLG